MTSRPTTLTKREIRVVVQSGSCNELFALYQGTTLVVPQRRKKEWALAPAQFSIEISADFTVAGAKAPTILAAEWHD
jgi:hypothetical protein